ncbi:MAG: hypothetical protein V4727_02810 [Verrucomicrobiota bacterium]
MKTKEYTHFSLIAAVYLIGGVALGEPTSKISSASIGVDVELIGESGLPLGTVFTVEGMIFVEKSKHHKEGDSRFIMIRKINDQVLKTPKKINLWDESVTEEGEWKTLIVIEDAQYSLSFIPNLSADDAEKDKGRQTIYTGLRIIKEAEQAAPSNGDKPSN